MTIRFTVQFNPPGSGITSVVIVPDNDNDDDDGSHDSFTATAGDANAVDMDAGAFGSVMELLSTLPTDVLEAAYRHRPVGHIATNTVGRTATTTLATTQPQLIGSASRSSPSNDIVTKARTPSAKPTAESLASAKTTAPSTPIKQHQSSAASTTDSNITPSTSSKVSNLPDTPRANASSSLQTSAQATATPPRAPVSTVRGRIDSPLHGIGVAHFITPKECYVVGHWTRTVLEFLSCEKEVVPIIEARLRPSIYDEDDIELQASLAEELEVDISHLIVKLLKLDAFLKSIGRAG